MKNNDVANIKSSKPKISKTNSDGDRDLEYTNENVQCL